jgi:hypothetical protein
MTDVLIRNLEPEDVARLDAQAAAVGLARNEYLRRRLQQEARRGHGPVTTPTLNDSPTDLVISLVSR